MEVYEEAIRLIYGYIYKEEKMDYHSLSEEVIEYIQGWRPRLPVEEFPENFPDETGYTGDYFTVYRGLCFQTQREYDTFIKNIKDGLITFSNVTSWSLSDRVAETFARGAGFKELTSFYKGVVLEITRIYPKDTFFASYLAHSELEFELSDVFSQIANENIHTLHEEEFVLIPGTYPVKIYKEINML